MDNATVVLSGYLKKSPPERRLMRTWHKRFFVLKSNKTLTYYPSEKEKRPVKDPVDLKHCNSIESNLHHNNKSFKHVFSINTKKRTYYLVADSKTEMEKWVKTLCEVCGFEKQDGKPSPDFRQGKSSPKTMQSRAQSQAVVHSPMTPSPPATCPLSMSTPVLCTPTKERTLSDPPDSSDNIRRATEQYQATLRRRSTSVVPDKGHMTLDLKPPLSRVPESYDILPAAPKHDRSPFSDTGSPLRNNQGFHTVDGDYAMLRQPSPPKTPTDRLPPRRKSTASEYDIVPPPRPASPDVYDVVPPPIKAMANEDGEDDVYDVPPAALYRGHDTKGNYDTVPAPRPQSQNGVYDYVPSHNQINQDQMYDMLPMRHNNEEDSGDGNYDTVPPPKPMKTNNPMECYDQLPPRSTQSNDIYDIPPNFQERNEENMTPPRRPPKPSAITPQNDLYDFVPPHNQKSAYSSPGQLDQFGGLPENRDSGLYADDIYDVPPKNAYGERDDIYDIPPKQSEINDDNYDYVPRRYSDDVYDYPPIGVHAEDSQGIESSAPPNIDRSKKPLSIDRNTKRAVHDYTNLAPPVNRQSKPPIPNHDGNHPYENMLPPDKRGIFIKSLPDSQNPSLANQEGEYYDMQPYRSDETRCYSFTRENPQRRSDGENYGEIVSNPLRRESGVHSNSSSSEDGEEGGCYMAMDAPDQQAKSQRKAASLQYCEVQIVEGQSKCQVPQAPRRNADSNYTTINEESTKAFLQTCREHDHSQKK